MFTEENEFKKENDLKGHMWSDREMIQIQYLYFGVFSIYTRYLCLPLSQCFPKCEMPKRDWFKEKALNNTETYAGKITPFLI